MMPLKKVNKDGIMLYDNLVLEINGKRYIIRNVQPNPWFFGQTKMRPSFELVPVNDKKQKTRLFSFSIFESEEHVFEGTTIKFDEEFYIYPNGEHLIYHNDNFGNEFGFFVE